MKDLAPWGFHNLRVHDLRHTVGRRLRAAGVIKETRSALLGHKTGDITTHYSAAEIQKLIDAVTKIVEDTSRTDSFKSSCQTIKKPDLIHCKHLKTKLL